MSVIYRLTEDNNWLNILEGSCITEERYNTIHYLSKSLFEPVAEFELKDFIEYKNELYCIEKGIEKILFYNDRELKVFLDKIQ